MQPEVKILALAALLQVVQFALMAVPLNMQLGVDWTLSPRDESREPVGVPARLFRAFNNHFEALILFTIAVVVVVLGNASSGFTIACAWAYLIARIVYIPLYAYGVPYARSVVWFIGFLATIAMLIAGLLA